VLASVVLAGIAVWVWAANLGHYKATTVSPQTSGSASPTASGSPNGAGQPSARNLDTPTPSAAATETPQPGVPPGVPQGNMLNTHSVGVGSTTPLVTTCSTQAGAVCHMQAKASDGTMKTSPGVTADSNGAAVINWTAKGVGLTAGSWEIRVVATLNGQSSTSNIFDTLVVQ
jgi:hypothetical protein